MHVCARTHTGTQGTFQGQHRTLAVSAGVLEEWLTSVGGVTVFSWSTKCLFRVSPTQGYLLSLGLVLLFC